MDIDILAFPWEKYKALFEQGKLNDDEFHDSEENTNMWDDAAAFSDLVESDSYLQYHAVYDNTAWFDKVDFESKREFIDFCKPLLNEEFTTDLGEEGEIECIATVISPARVEALSALSESVNLDVIKEVHQKFFDMGVNWDNNQLLEISTMQEGDYIAISDYLMDSNDYVSYIESLMKFVRGQRGKDTCLAIHIG